MTNNRSTNEQIQERVNYAADELAKGKRAMDISKKLASNIMSAFNRLGIMLDKRNQY